MQAGASVLFLLAGLWFDLALGDPDFHPAGANRDLSLFLSGHGFDVLLFLFANLIAAEEISFVWAVASFDQYPVNPKRSVSNSPCVGWWFVCLGMLAAPTARLCLGQQRRRNHYSGANAVYWSQTDNSFLITLPWMSLGDSSSDLLYQLAIAA